MTVEQFKEQFRGWVESNPLRIKRKDDGLTTVELAALLGVSHKTIQYWENNTTKPDENNMRKVADYLGVSPEEAQKQWQDWLQDKPTNL